MRTANLKNEERAQIAQFLLQHSVDGVAKKGTINEMAAKYSVSRTVGKLWAIARRQMAAGSVINVLSRRKGKKGKPRKVMDVEAVKAIPYQKRTTLETLSIALKVSISLVHKWVKEGLVRSHTNAIKPILTKDNKINRLIFSLTKLIYDDYIAGIKFKEQVNIIHLDEKWFHLSKETKRYYLLPEEEEPQRTTGHKDKIPKLSFICAVGRPDIAPDGEVIFDGKIGIWPFTKVEAAKRKSKYRPRGTMITKPLKSITRESHLKMLIEHIIPTIIRVWPANRSKSIIIEQDNAPVHVPDDDEDFRRYADATGFDIHLRQQPASSPDLNVLDLGFFNSIQLLQTKTSSYTLPKLVEAVQTAFRDLSANTLNNVWISWQAVMLQIRKIKGSNMYKLPHLKKAALARQGLLHNELDADEDMVRECIDYLIELGRGSTLKDLMEDLGYAEEEINAPPAMIRTQ